jgi:xylulokinase
MSWPLAGRTMLFDVRAHRWAPRILDELGLAAERLPRTLPSGAPVGTIPSGVARDLGLPEGVLVVAGGHDQTCAALGVGVTSGGRAVWATGTVECICPAFAQPRFDAELMRSNLCTYDFTARGMYTTVAFSLTGGNILKWFRDQFGAGELAQARDRGVSAYELLLAQMPAQPAGLLVLPYFTPSGTPYFDAHAAGAILGLSLSTTRGEVVRALLEGVALEMRLNIDILERAGLGVEEYVASGGGARSRAWVQLKADVSGRPISTVGVTESGCLGAAMLARAAREGAPLDEVAHQMIKPTGRVEPDPARARIYDERFAAYRELYPALTSFGFAHE